MTLSSFKNKKWLIKDIDSPRVREIRDKHGVSRLLAHLLTSREIREPDDVEKFLHPQLAQLPSPFLLKGADRAVQIISEAFENNETILLYGDYDVDGVTAVSVIAIFLMALDRPFILCHPNRIDDGYGLKASVVEQKTNGHNVHDLILDSTEQ